MKAENLAIPKKRTNTENVLEQLKGFKGEDPDWKGGRTWGLVYYANEDHYKLLKESYTMFMSENGLNPMAFKSLKKLESEVVRMSVNLLNGNDQCVGTMTSGGTESIMMAIKTYRDRARVTNPSIRQPEVIVPESVHVAFDKAGKYFDVKIVHAPLSDDYRVDVKAVKKLINKNTILIVGSAPQYPQGVIDPIQDLAKLALDHKLPLHVDACVGGFVLPWIEKLGNNVPLWDFRVNGVTSISADLHKYGYAAKGASLILYKSMDYLKHQFFVFENWPGGIFASPSMPGTRPGGAIAAAWATLMSMGEEGYLNLTNEALTNTKKLVDGINAIKGLKVCVNPDATIFSYMSDETGLSIFAIGDYMEEKGWFINRQQRPESLHAMVTVAHTNSVDLYLADLKDAVAHVRANPSLNTEGKAAMYGMMAKVPFRGMIRKSVLAMMEQMYSADGKMPDLSAEDPESQPTAEKLGMKVLQLKRLWDMMIAKITGRR